MVSDQGGGGFSVITLSVDVRLVLQGALKKTADYTGYSFLWQKWDKYDHILEVQQVSLMQYRMTDDEMKSWFPFVWKPNLNIMFGLSTEW